MMRSILTAWVLIVLLPISVFATDPGTQKSAAVEAAQNWLATIDAGHYAQSWEHAAGTFKTMVPQKEWVNSLRAVRKPLGGLISRVIQSAQYTTQLLGAPDGAYVVIHFATSFENKKGALETVTPMLDQDGQWRVSGYYIK